MSSISQEVRKCSTRATVTCSRCESNSQRPARACARCARRPEPRRPVSGWHCPASPRRYMIRVEVQAASWTRLAKKPGSRRTPPGFLFECCQPSEGHHATATVPSWKERLLLRFPHDRRVRDHRGRRHWRLSGSRSRSRRCGLCEDARGTGRPSRRHRTSATGRSRGTRKVIVHPGLRRAKHAASKTWFARRSARLHLLEHFQRFSRKIRDLSSLLGARRRAQVHNGTPSSSSAGHVARSGSLVRNGRRRSHDTFATIKRASWSCGSRHSGLRHIGGHSEYGQRRSRRPGTVFVDRVCPQHQCLFAARFDRALESQRCARNPVCPLGRRGARRDRKDAGREKVTHHPRPAAGISCCQSLPARLFSYCDFMSEARTVRSSSITLATCNCMTSSCC